MNRYYTKIAKVFDNYDLFPICCPVVHYVADRADAVVALADDILREFEGGPVPMLAAPVGCRFERPKTSACVEPKPQNRRSL